MPKLKMKLYILGNYHSSIEAINTMQSILQNIPKKEYEFKIINMLNTPEIAEKDNILVVPTLIKFNPLPKRKLVGSFKDRERIIHELNLAAE